MVGTEKQVNWATDIKVRVEQMAEYLKRYFELIKIHKADVLEKRKGLARSVDTVIEELDKLTQSDSAKFYIDNFGSFTSGRTQQERADEFVRMFMNYLGQDHKAFYAMKAASRDMASSHHVRYKEMEEMAKEIVK